MSATHARTPVMSRTSVRMGAALLGSFSLLALITMTSRADGAGGAQAVKAQNVNAPAITAPTSTVSQSTTSDGKSDCGGTTIYKSNGTKWTCTFDDEFDGTSLNTKKWTPVTTATSGYHSGIECDVNSSNNLSVSGGALKLTVRKEAAPFVCTDPLGNYQTQYTSASLTSLNNFSQTYGYFEVKAKFPAATVAGLQSSLWMWPVNALKYGYSWPASGEIDIAEWYSEYPQLAIPSIHYNPAGGSDPDDTNDYCAIANPTEYNTYGVTWTPTTLTITYDGDTCLVDTWNPAAPLVKPAPFNEPFVLELTQALGIYTNNFNPSATQLPASTYVDWVRAWS
jgi:beta-glucanase (GH16 family)